MSDATDDRGKLPRTRVRLQCHMQLSTGLQIQGFTQELSQDAALVETQPLPLHRQQMAPRVGHMGLLVLRYRKEGEYKSMKIRCRIAHVQAGRFGLTLFYSKLATQEQRDLDQIIRTGSGDV